MKKLIVVATMLLTQVVWSQDLSSNLKGHWQFDDANNLTLATVGQDLVLVGTDSAMAGPGEGNGAVYIPTGSYYTAVNPIDTLLSEGSYVNEFTIVLDMRIPSLAWTAIYQTDITNASDGDAYVTSAGAIGIGDSDYSDAGVFSPRNWHKVAISVLNTDTAAVDNGFYNIYIDGLLVLDGVPQPLDARFSLREKILFAADNDGEDSPIEIAELWLYDKALDDSEVGSLGGYSVHTGKWTFNDTTALDSASIGTNLEFVGDITASVGPFPGDGAVSVPLGSHMIATHGIDPSASDGAMANAYTIVMDVMVPVLGSWYVLMQTDLTNTSDGDLAIRPTGEIGITATGYTYDSLQVAAGEWYRIAVVVESDSRYDIYADGKLVLRGDITDVTVDGRFALDTKVIIAGDNDGDDGEINISNISVYQVALTDQDIADMGGFAHVSGNTLVGHWTFDDVANPLAATVGNDLVLVGTHEPTDGPTFGNLGATIGLESHYIATHGIDTLLSIGNKVNMYTVVIDFRVAALGVWRSFFQTDTSNTTDTDCAMRTTGEIGIGDTGYTYDLFAAEAGTWYRLTVAVLNGLRYDFYIDGEFVMEGSVQSVDGRFSLDDKLLIFADQNGDDGVIDVAEIMLFSTYLNADSIAALGGPGGVLSTNNRASAPSSFKLSQNYPNPFNPATTIGYTLPSNSQVDLVVYNILGQEVMTLVNKYQMAGVHSVSFNGSSLASGIYFYRLTAGKKTINRKMLLLK